jgi:hypothetical protein
VRWERTQSFKSDYKRLSERDRDLLKAAVAEFNDVCDAYVVGHAPWPVRLRVKSVEGAPGVFEMTWSFSGPDGRATWEWVTVTDDTGRHPVVRWRRVGDHRIFRSP